MALSEPKVLVISGIRERWKASERHNDAATMNGVEAWVYAMNGDYIGENTITEKDITRYDIVICNTNEVYTPRRVEKLLRLCESRPSHTQWVTLIEGSASDYLIPSQKVRNLLQSSSLINCINRHSVPLFRALSSTPTEYIGIPYPLDEIVRYRVPIEQRIKKVLCCGLLLKRWNDYYAAKSTGLAYYGYERGFSRKLRYMVKNWQTHRAVFNNKKAFQTIDAIYQDPQLEIRKLSSLHDYFSHNAYAWLWINLDDRYTWGRYVLDAAALGIPIISTPSTGHAPELFPLTMVDTPFSLDKATELAKTLVNDREFYQTVADYPLAKMDYLRPENMKNTLLSYLNI